MNKNIMTLAAVATLFLGGTALGEPMGKAAGASPGGDAKTGAAQKSQSAPGEGGKTPGVEGRSAAPGAPSDAESSGAGPANEKNTGAGPAKAPAKGGAAAAQTEPKGATQPKAANAGAGPDQKTQTGRSSAHISSDDRTKVRSEISRVQIREATNLNFRVNVGGTAPRTITEYWEPVPQEIVTIVPAWSGYRVVKIGNEILIIEPDTYQIVDVLED